MQRRDMATPNREFCPETDTSGLVIAPSAPELPRSVLLLTAAAAFAIAPCRKLASAPPSAMESSDG
jgi:hypothetical protein